MQIVLPTAKHAVVFWQIIMYWLALESFFCTRQSKTQAQFYDNFGKRDLIYYCMLRYSLLRRKLE